MEYFLIEEPVPGVSESASLVPDVNDPRPGLVPGPNAELVPRELDALVNLPPELPTDGLPPDPALVREVPLPLVDGEIPAPWLLDEP